MKATPSQRAAGVAGDDRHLKQFLLVFALATCACSLSYGLAHVVPAGFRDHVAWPLLPGVALYAVANGSLAFGSGFGQLGNFVFIVLGSALAWAGLVTLGVHVARRWWPAQPSAADLNRGD